MADTSASSMVDVHFPVRGAVIPEDHRLSLTGALLAALPWLADDDATAIHPVNTAPGGAGSSPSGTALLSTRSRLIIRTKRARADALTKLEGQVLDVDGTSMALGPARSRELLPHSTLYAHFVCCDQPDEGEFIEALKQELDRLQVRSHLVCGKQYKTRLADGPHTGYSLMLHGLSRSSALQVLEHGLGPHRLFGCGMFVPHKSAAAVGGDD